MLRLGRLRHGRPVKVAVVPAEHDERVGTLGDIALIAAHALQGAGTGAAEAAVVVYVQLQLSAEQVDKRILAADISSGIVFIYNSTGYRITYYTQRTGHVQKPRFPCRNYDGIIIRPAHTFVNLNFC